MRAWSQGVIARSACRALIEPVEKVPGRHDTAASGLGHEDLAGQGLQEVDAVPDATVPNALALHWLALAALINPAWQGLHMAAERPA